MTISNLQTRSFLYGRLDETNRLEDTEDVKVKISESDIRRTSEFRAVPRRHHITPHRAPSEAASVRSESAPVTHPRYPGALISAGSTQRPLVTHNNVVQEDVVQVKHPLFIATTRSNSGMRPLERASLRQTARPVNRRRVNGTVIKEKRKIISPINKLNRACALEEEIRRSGLIRPAIYPYLFGRVDYVIL
jgi:hypothetical protein